MNNKNTVEGKAKTKNGVKRMIFVVLTIFLEILLIFFLITQLSNAHAALAEAILRIVAVFLVLYIYSKPDTSAMKMPWVILIMALSLVGVILYFLIGKNGGTKKMTRRYKNVDAVLLPILARAEGDGAAAQKLQQLDPEAAGISRYLRDRAGYPVWQNTDIEYYDDASDGLEAQLKEMRKAEKFIFMEYHAIEDKESWHRIEEILEEKAAHNVEVRVFYDDMGSIGFINTDFVKKLESKGIACRVFNPFVPGLNAFLNNRDHRKITVIDGKVGFTGGYNLANEYFNLTHPYGQWKDTGIRLEGDAVQALTVTFLENWNASKDTKKEPMDTDFMQYLPKYDYTARQSGFIQPYADSPMDEERIGEDVYISMAEKANKYCYFVTPYLILTDEMIHSLCLAAKRGVDVRIVTPGIPDKKMIYSVTRSFYAPLVKYGVRIYEWTPGFCHCKMSVADDKMSTCGTINMDYRSLYHHFENGCWMYDRDIAVSIRKDMESMFAQGTEVTEKYHSKDNSSMKLSMMFLRLFAGLL